MKNITLLVLSFLVFSCGIEYDGETRMAVETRVVDSNGSPMTGTEVSINVSDMNYTDNISVGETDANGRLLLIFPAPVSDSINVTIVYSPIGEFQQKTFYNIHKSDFDNYKLSLPEVVLFSIAQITTLQIVLDHTGTNTQITDIHIEGVTPDGDVDFHPEDDDYYYDYPLSFSVLKNTDIILKYSVRNNMTVTEYSVNLAVADDPLTHTITY